ncbi:MAG: c-type cytochrome biogenesis protein CcmI [Porticoccaceae bacterium]|nr:c-type cytochrome biogenesis protein CcmI [Porticoccaceae bacterium]
MMLWILVVTALGFLVYPFVIEERQSAVSLDEEKNRKNTNVRLFKEQQDQLQQQQDRGEIDSEQYQRLVMDAQRLLLANTELDAIEGSKIAGTGRWLLPLLLMGTFGTTWAIYSDIGAAEDEKIVALMNKMATLETESTDIPELNQELISTIEGRVKERTSNIYYWVILAQAAIADNNILAASNYFSSALKVEPRDSQLLAQYAETLFLVDDNKFTQRVRAAVDKAFAADSNNQTVLGLKGIEAFAGKNFELAETYWLGAQSQVNPESAVFKGLQVGIDRARDFIAENSGSDTDVSQLSEIQVELRIDLSLGAKVPRRPDQRVFIAAVRESGPPMPLAAKKILASQLPMRVVLTDKDAIIPGQDLTTEIKIKVIARLSNSGSATPQSGDWEASSESVDLDSFEGEIMLVIDRQRP